WNDHGPPLPDRPGTPGADDNASGVAALLEIARLMARTPTERTVRFVAFVNEEPPFFKTECMGSLVYARECAKRDAGKIVGAIVLEQVGCYSVRPRTKRPWFASLVGIPDRPDYVAFFSNYASRHCISPPDFTGSLSWSDDWSFWQEGFLAFSACDTTYMRHDDYHELDDTADRLDYATMADVAWGLLYVVRELANPREGPRD
ncbi:MAG: M20/M25/M40 family metallo-hydrolase, partial [Planctomycetes bacterium]|nr:M20/M25/M40 family metallo-hydrolase [Planctomycetota bacterium]